MVYSEIWCNLPKMSAARSCNNLNDISLQYGEDRVSYHLSLFLYTITVMVLIVVLSTTDNIALSPSPTMLQIALAADVTITKIQLPGIIYNNDNYNPSSDSNASSNNSDPPPPPITHNTRARPATEGPTLNDSSLKVDQIINRGFDDPTSMAFLGPNDILVLEKNTGKVHRILNGKILPEPLLDVNVANEAERGLLGIDIANDNGNGNNIGGDIAAAIPGITGSTNPLHVFLYYTESGGGKDGDDVPLANSSTIITSTDDGNVYSTGGDIPPAGNRLYRYDLLMHNNNNNSKLTTLNGSIV